MQKKENQRLKGESRDRKEKAERERRKQQQKEESSNRKGESRDGKEKAETERRKQRYRRRHQK
jgi:hypothetical protein